MPYLFAITVVAFIALLWAAFSAAQHIRRARRRRRMAWSSALPETHPSEAAASLEPWLEPDSAQLEVHAPPPPAEPATHEKQPIRFPLSTQRPAPPPPAAEGPEPSNVTPIRRPPVSVTPETRPDWAYYNKDMGDLSDPVAAPRLKDRNGRHR